MTTSFRHSVTRTYTVEWIDRDEGVHELDVRARAATLAEDKAEKLLSKRADFLRIESVDLSD